jgi:peptidoglycan hydrolase CwlO-like protein
MNIGKKILSAFVEVSEDKKPPGTIEVVTSTTPVVHYQPTADTGKFKQYFHKLFEEANILGPDYYEFSRMIEAMKAIPDEKARYLAAFAGLSVQGLDKARLLSTAGQYLQVLETDASNFNNTIDAALHEKVVSKKGEIEEKSKRIQQLSQEIADLQNKIAVLQNEIKENEEKIESNSSGYQTELVNMKNKIVADIEKIKQHIN